MNRINWQSQNGGGALGAAESGRLYSIDQMESGKRIVECDTKRIGTARSNAEAKKLCERHEARTPIRFTSAEQLRIRWCISRVWGSIAADVEDGMGRCSNAQALELSIELLEIHCHKQEYDLVKKFFRASRKEQARIVRGLRIN